jgi:hypothetical protein
MPEQSQACFICGNSHLDAAMVSKDAISFVGVVQNMYLFLSALT